MNTVETQNTPGESFRKIREIMAQPFPADFHESLLSEANDARYYSFKPQPTDTEQYEPTSY